MEWSGRAFPAGLFRDICVVPGSLLNDGLLLVKDKSKVLFRYDELLIFNVNDVVEEQGLWLGKWRAPCARPSSGKRK